MIEINLLPGGGKKRRRTSAVGMPKFDPRALFAGISEKFTDKYLLGAVGAASVSGAVIVLLFLSQTARARSLEEAELKAIKDSTQFSAVLTAKAKAEATRDSLYQQIAIIKSIDDSRYLWSHLMYEISNALPQYTWLREVAQTSPPKSVAAADTVKRAATPADTATSPKARAERARAKQARADSLLAEAREIRFRVVGHTVDIQALTRFMKSLEASPFIQNVQLTRSDLVVNEGKEVTEFSLEAETQTPPAFAIKTVPLIVSAVR
ncbi:MAG TPA: PilN domain-containing protein [Gemmatimonadaceae bacterium]|nr:PilN domain-containing protein [Gemmatimonadaceae bacterium]